MKQDFGILTDLKLRLERRGVPYQPTSDGVRVPAAADAGFDASIRFDGEACHVELDGWHDQFESYEDGVNWFVWALSSACRLAITKRWFDHKWTLQRRHAGSWQDASTTGLLFFPYFLRGQTRYLQNEWRDSDLADLD